MSSDVFFAVRAALVYWPTVNRPQAQLIRELIDRVARRVRRVDVDRFGPAVQEEKPTHDGAQSPHGLKHRTFVSRRQTSSEHRWNDERKKKKIGRTAISTVDGGYCRHETFVFLQLSRHHWTYCLSFPSLCKFFRKKLTKYCKRTTTLFHNKRALEIEH